MLNTSSSFSYKNSYTDQKDEQIYVKSVILNIYFYVLLTFLIRLLTEISCSINAREHRDKSAAWYKIMAHVIKKTCINNWSVRLGGEKGPILLVAPSLLLAKEISVPK